MASIESKVIEIAGKYKKQARRLMDMLLDIQNEYRHIPNEAIVTLARECNISQVDIEQTISFYHFFSLTPVGKYTVYLNDSAVACMMGRNEIAKAFEKEAGIKFGEVTPDGLIGLFNTACIGMNDQEPAAIINGVVFTKLNEEKVQQLVKAFRNGKNVRDLVFDKGDGANATEFINSMVNNNIRKKGPVIFTETVAGNAIKKLVNMTPEQVIAEIKASNLKGRGGAGFPTGMKWDFCNRSEDKDRFVICNADEGEPGTFKDRVLLTELPSLVFEGMTIAGYAIGAKKGILYLRNEYVYLKSYLEKVLDAHRKNNLLGLGIAGKKDFNFEIRIQFGAGAYVCGEESALIESAEGKRGEPRNRPPFPVTKGYIQKPTVVNNVETLCSVTKIIEKGADWYKGFGTADSTGTKVLSVSGDCAKPGIYEIEWGMTIKDMLEMCGAEKDIQALQVAGPSGVCINPSQFGRKIANEDLPTGGSMIVIGKKRELLKDVVANFMDFFVDESCGSCVPCRALTPVLKEKLEKVIAGKGVKQDIDDMVKLGKMMKDLNRCGLGQTCANPILTTIENFRDKYESLVKAPKADGVYDFDMKASVKDSCEVVKRKINVH
ncbi:MAG TPA: NAD(P)H-dependent oxidoreductase subunit E [Bacteroidales bacterium]|nr:NAD(P)H-dependent oxidoreductase subunit E [Bacteroidales bacterium]HPS16867.1 NAD(P)H-dependent oxidoreductase subunit E [Bacteroidales bacterium]